jgi:hypothetical protein
MGPFDFRYDSAFEHIINHIPSGVHIGPATNEWAIVVSPKMPPMDELSGGLLQVTIPLCNPMPIRRPEIVLVEEVAPIWSDKYLIERPKLKVIHADKIYAYSDELVRIAREIQSRSYHGLIVPLRGGLKPWLQLDVMTELQIHDCWLPFTQGSNGLDRDQIRHHLVDFINSCEPTSPLKLAVVDTANSGHSSNQLAEIIRSIHTDRADGAHWQVHFYLIFEQTNPTRHHPPLSAEIPGKSNERLHFDVFPHAVPDLIAEDWDEALGIKCGWEDGLTPEIRIFPSRGRFALQEGSGYLKVIESDRLDRYTDLLLGEAVSDNVITLPGFRHTHDVWARFTGDGSGHPSRP